MNWPRKHVIRDINVCLSTDALSTLREAIFVSYISIYTSLQPCLLKSSRRNFSSKCRSRQHRQMFIKKSPLHHHGIRLRRTQRLRPTWSPKMNCLLGYFKQMQKSRKDALVYTVAGKRKLLQLPFLIGLNKNGAMTRYDQGQVVFIAFTPKDGRQGKSSDIGLLGTFVSRLNGPGHETNISLAHVDLVSLC